MRGWINYYGRFYRSELIRSLRRINEYLMRWAMRKYKRLRRRPQRAWDLVAAVDRRRARALRPLGSESQPRPDDGSRVIGRLHVRF